MVEHTGFEPVTPTLPVWCAPSCANAPSMAEMVGFEPTEHFIAQTISSRSRYDHFDTSPRIIVGQLEPDSLIISHSGKKIKRFCKKKLVKNGKSLL